MHIQKYERWSSHFFMGDIVGFLFYLVLRWSLYVLFFVTLTLLLSFLLCVSRELLKGYGSICITFWFRLGRNLFWELVFLRRFDMFEVPTFQPPINSIIWSIKMNWIGNWKLIYLFFFKWLRTLIFYFFLYVVHFNTSLKLEAPAADQFPSSDGAKSIKTTLFFDTSIGKFFSIKKWGL